MKCACRECDHVRNFVFSQEGASQTYQSVHEILVKVKR